MPDDALPVLITIDPLVPAVPASGVLTVKEPLDLVAPTPLEIDTDPPTLAVLTPLAIDTDPPAAAVLLPANTVTDPPVPTPVPPLSNKAPLDPTKADPV